MIGEMLSSYTQAIHRSRKLHNSNVGVVHISKVLCEAMGMGYLTVTNWEFNTPLGDSVRLWAFLANDWVKHTQ